MSGFSFRTVSVTNEVCTYETDPSIVTTMGTEVGESVPGIGAAALEEYCM